MERWNSMFLNSFEKPIDLLQLEAADRRVKPNHPQKQKIFADYKKKLGGYFGEKEVHYYLQSLNKDQYHIIHNIRLNVSNQYFQIDFLILTTSYFVILEVKNFIGKVTFNDFNQMILTKHDQTQESIQNPITQSERQVLHLQNWLLQNGFPYIPIYSYVVFSSPTTLLINNSGNQDVSKKIISGSNIVPVITNLSKVSGKQVIKTNEIRKISTKLLKAHTPLKTDILLKYQIRQDELLKGFQCPACSNIPLIRKKSLWSCPNCHYLGKHNFIQDINDFYLLVGETLTNKQLREFLHISSRSTANYLLQKAGYRETGKTRGRKYILELK